MIDREANGHWKPGSSGNPKGRQPTGKTLTDLIQKQLSKGHNKTNKTKGEVLATVLVELALDDRSLPAIREIIDRIEGKALQSLEHTGRDGGPIATVQQLVLLLDRCDLTPEQLVKLRAELGE